MKTKMFTVVMLLVLVLSVVGLTACNNGNDETTSLRFTAPEGTPALAIARLLTDNRTIGDKTMEYAIISPSLIAAEISGAKSDLVIMPINAGANLIAQGADYKLVGVAVEGNLYLVGKADKDTLMLDDIKGKKIACIGKTGIPGLVLNYILNNAFNLSDSVATNVQYVADGNAAKALLDSGEVDFAVVGEPAATVFKTKFGYNAKMDIQEEYGKLAGAETYPQAGIFARTALANDSTFMMKLFEAMAASKVWINSNASEVTAFMQENAYASAAFPATSIPNCAIKATALTDADKTDIVSFLKKIMPENSAGNAIDWDNIKLF